jgi:hypothetical protein
MVLSIKIAIQIANDYGENHLDSVAILNLEKSLV